MKARTVTSHDVARLAGVGRSTVSHVLNGSNAVRLSDETRRKVQQAALKLGYRPNSAALMLRHGTTRTVGLLATPQHSLAVDHYVQLLFTGIGRVLRREGYHLLLETFEEDAGGDRYAELVLTRRIDGLIVLSPDSQSDELRSLVDNGFPIVLIGTIHSDRQVSVEGQVDQAMNDAVAHLKQLGHRTLGCVPFAPPGFPASDMRTATLRTLLKRHGLLMDEDAIEHANFSVESGHLATRTLLARRPDLTALLAGNDTIALGAIGGAARAGLQVPRDLSVMGFDDLPFAAWMDPPLSTIHQDAVRQGEVAAQLLVERLTGQLRGAKQVQEAARFVARQSTAAARPR